MIIMNPLYPPVLGDFFNIWGTPHSTGSGQAPMPPAVESSCTSEKDIQEGEEISPLRLKGHGMPCPYESTTRRLPRRPSRMGRAPRNDT